MTVAEVGAGVDIGLAEIARTVMVRPVAGCLFSQVLVVGGRGRRWGSAGGWVAAIRSNAVTIVAAQGQVLARRSRRRRAPRVRRAGTCMTR